MCEHCIDASLMCPSHILLNLTSSDHMTFFPLLHSPIFMLPKSHLFPISLINEWLFLRPHSCLVPIFSPHCACGSSLNSTIKDMWCHQAFKKKQNSSYFFHKIDSPLLSFQILLTYWTGLSVILACFLSWMQSNSLSFLKHFPWILDMSSNIVV